MTNRFVWRVVLALALLPLAADWAAGQTVVTTGPVSTADRVELTSTEPTVAAAQSLAYRARVDQPPTGPFTVLTVTCAIPAGGTAVVCTGPLPAALVTALNVRGTHTVTITAFDSAANLEGAASIPFVLISPPGAPTGVRIIR